MEPFFATPSSRIAAGINWESSFLVEKARVLEACYQLTKGFPVPRQNAKSLELTHGSYLAFLSPHYPSCDTLFRLHWWHSRACIALSWSVSPGEGTCHILYPETWCHEESRANKPILSNLSKNVPDFRGCYKVCWKSLKTGAVH